MIEQVSIWSWMSTCLIGHSQSPKITNRYVNREENIHLHIQLDFTHIYVYKLSFEGLRINNFVCNIICYWILCYNTIYRRFIRKATNSQQLSTNCKPSLLVIWKKHTTQWFIVFNNSVVIIVIDFKFWSVLRII